jgi:diaminopimelate epimerase
MQDVSGIEQLDLDCILNTGSPHFVRFQHLPDEAGLLSIARDIRYSDRFREAGININLAEKVTDGYLRIRTYERGVEAETFSCGTGAVACALSEAHRQKIIGSHQFQIETLGGSLSVAFTRHETGAYTDIWLIGPAVKVYEGSIRW